MALDGRAIACVNACMCGEWTEIMQTQPNEHFRIYDILPSNFVANLFFINIHFSMFMST